MEPEDEIENIRGRSGPEPSRSGGIVHRGLERRITGQLGTASLEGALPVIAIEKQVIGKEANELEQVETGLVQELKEVQMIYRQDQSEELREWLHGMPVKAAMELTGLSGQQMFYLRAGRGNLRPEQLRGISTEHTSRRR